MIESKNRIIVASASQNLDMGSNNVVHRFIPMFVAENLTRVNEYETDTPASKRVDMWNCVGMRMDKAYATQKEEHNSRYDFSTSLLNIKYEILEMFGIPKTGREIVRDDDKSTQNWLEQKLVNLLASGSIYLDTVTTNVCSRCGYLQSIDGSNTRLCTICNGKDFYKEDKKVLMVDVPKDRESLIKDAIIHPRNIKHIRSFFEQLPSRMMISKVREYGLPLDSIGLHGYVLDPKIGVSLMPEMVCQRYQLDEITLVQGATTATNVIPYTTILSKELQHKYILLPKIPITTLSDAKNMGMSFIGRHLPLVLMTYKGDITPSQLKTAQVEYSRIVEKIDRILILLQSKTTQSVCLRAEDTALLAEVMDDFRMYRIRAGQEKLWLLFRSQGRRYAEELEKAGYYLSPTDVDTLDDIVRLFYK